MCAASRSSRRCRRRRRWRSTSRTRRASPCSASSAAARSTSTPSAPGRVERRHACCLRSALGVGQKPHHYREMVRVAWENRDQLPFAWRILRDGVCDGCALGTTGLRDWTLRRHPPLHGAARAAAPEHGAGARSGARSPTSQRCATSVLGGAARARPPAGADAAPARRAAASASSLGRGARRGRAPTHPRDRSRAASRSTSPRAASPNEVYYAAQKAARCLGTNHVDNSARLCHAASTVAMKATLGHGASTCCYTRLARRRPHRLLRLEHRQQPAGHDEVPATRRSRSGAAGRGRQPVPRARAGALLGARRCPRARSSARRSPTTGSTCTRAATSRS